MIPHSRSEYILLALLACLLIVPAPASACSPSPPSPWLPEHLSFDELALPDGVKLYARNERAIMLANSSDTPLYVIGTLYVGNDDVAPLPVTLPDGTAPVHKLVDGQLFHWQAVQLDPERPPERVWDKERFLGGALKLRPGQTRSTQVVVRSPRSSRAIKSATIGHQM